MQMTRVKTWEISDEFWALVEPHVPQHERDPGKVYKRKAGGGRKPTPARNIFAAIVYVLRNGLIWNALPKEKFGVCSSAVHRVFQEWCAAGFFAQIWRAGLVEYDEMEGIAWEWQAADGCLIKAPLARESVGPNPTDRGKKRKQTSPAGRRAWHPAVDRRQRRPSPRQRQTGGTA
jgi:transposase